VNEPMNFLGLGWCEEYRRKEKKLQLVDEKAKNNDGFFFRVYNHLCHFFCIFCGHFCLVSLTLFNFFYIHFPFIFKLFNAKILSSSPFFFYSTKYLFSCWMGFEKKVVSLLHKEI